MNKSILEGKVAEKSKDIHSLFIFHNVDKAFNDRQRIKNNDKKLCECV